MESTAIANWHRVSEYLASDDEHRWFTSEKESVDFDAIMIEIIESDYDCHEKLILEHQKDFNKYFFYSSEDKRNIVKHYIFEFSVANDLMIKNYDFLFDDEIIVDDVITFTSKRSGNLSRNQKYVLGLLDIMNDVFLIIQKFCFLSKIDFFEVCEELDFNLGIIWCDFTIDKNPELKLENERKMNRLNGMPSLHPKTYEDLVELARCFKVNPVAYNFILSSDILKDQLSKDITSVINDLLLSEEKFDSLNKIKSPSEISGQSESKNPLHRKTFQEYFIDKKRSEEYANVCNSLFSVQRRGKSDAMMICLLTQHSMIAIPNKKRKDFYIAWFTFINAELPKNSNFSKINNFITDLGTRGFCYKDQTDSDYLIFDNTLFNLLKSVK